MCEIHDAERHEELARLLEKQNERKEARENLLEAASIYILQSDLQKSKKLLKKANQCYKKAKEIIGETMAAELEKKELAQRILTESEIKEQSDILGDIEQELRGI